MGLMNLYVYDHKVVHNPNGIDNVYEQRPATGREVVQSIVPTMRVAVSSSSSSNPHTAILTKH